MRPGTDSTLDRRQRVLGAVALGCVGAVLLGMAGRVVYINANPALRGRLLAVAEQQHEGESVLPAQRGMIYDCRERTIAVSRQLPDVFVDAARVSDANELAQALAPRLNVAPVEIVQRIAARPTSRFVVIAEGVDEETAKAVRGLKHPAVGLQGRSARSYPLGPSMAHVLGFVGRDGRGLEGIELSLDEHLRGHDGRRESIRDSRRRPLYRPTDEGCIEPVDGGHVVLTIDAELQRVTERAVQRQIEEFHAESGIGIIISPDDGDILAMACLPAYDPNDGGNAPAALRRNRAITDPVEPGSTFKPFIASAALQHKVISPTELIDCKMGTHFFGRRRITDTHPHGMLDLRGIIAKSSNIGMNFIIERLGARRSREVMRAFGFGERTGVELIGESSGLVYPLSMWSRGSMCSVAMGYEVSVTPIQLAAAFAALVNNGERIRPRVVKSLIAADGSEVSVRAPEPLGQAIPADVARYMAQDLLASVVEEGTGSNAKLDRYQTVGKTGTAKLVRRDGKGGYEPGQYLSVYMGAAPADHPRVCVLVLIRRPEAKLGYYGGTVAAPAVREILAHALPYLGVPPDDGALLAGR